MQYSLYNFIMSMAQSKVPCMEITIYVTSWQSIVTLSIIS
jgi:hypothetical protein